MEDELDEIADKKREWVSVVQDFYSPFEKSLERASQVMERVKLSEELTEETCPQCGKPLAIKIGRYGKFLACSGYPDCKYTKSLQIKTGVSCPECGGEVYRLISGGVGIIFKGNGFYVTDNKTNKYSEKSKSKTENSPDSTNNKAKESSVKKKS